MFFWNELESILATSSSSVVSDCHVINRMTSIYNLDFEVSECHTWLDIGNTNELNASRERTDSELEVLDKVEENIYLIDDSIVKFFHDEKISNRRVSRADKLKGLAPNITGHRNNFYKYDRVDGQSFAKTINEDKLKSFLEWCSGDLWKPKPRTKEFEETCSNFYFDKTIERIAKLEKATGIEDKEEVINNMYCRPVKEILVNLDKYK